MSDTPTVTRGDLLAALEAAQQHRQRPLLDHVREIFPNAGPVWQGIPLTNAAEIGWDADGGILVTPDESHNNADGWLIGVYPAWEESEPLFYVEMGPDVPDVLRYLDAITEPPEGVDWGAWADQWTLDAIADGRLDAIHFVP